jgi:hypothetical protein
MKDLAPVPENAVLGVVADGYQICARCGKVLVEDETAVMVPRLSNWLIHTHNIGPNCRAKAVRGWLAVSRANHARKLANKTYLREGFAYIPGGKLRACVCLLDQKHIDAELRLAEYWPSDELQMLLTEGLEGRKYFLFEEDLLDAIEANVLGDFLRIFLDVVWSCRKESYADVKTAPESDSAVLFSFPPMGKKGRATPKHPRLAKASSEGISWDILGRPVEFALYSKVELFEINGKSLCELETFGSKADPVDLGYSITTAPDAYLWDRNGEWHYWGEADAQMTRAVDSEHLYGPVARLHPDNIRRLNEQRNGAFRGENILYRVELETESVGQPDLVASPRY